jgi:hypothetical protein
MESVADLNPGDLEGSGGQSRKPDSDRGQKAGKGRENRYSGGQGVPSAKYKLDERCAKQGAEENEPGKFRVHEVKT